MAGSDHINPEPIMRRWVVYAAQLSNTKIDAILKLQAAKDAASRARPPDGGGP